MELSQSSSSTIMDLPDDILCAIISCLPMREAMKTSALSKRWRYLWPLSMADIDFDEPLMSTIDFLDCFDKSRFPRTASSILDLHTASKIHTFRICFRFCPRMSEESIDRWITFAIKKQAEKLMFKSISSFPLRLLDDGRVSPSLKHLHLSSCMLGPVNQACGLSSLKTLWLESVTFDCEQSLQSLISGCPLLESLSIRHCDHLHNLIIDNSFSRLKHLSVLQLFASLVISCSNLISLESTANFFCLCDDHGLDSLQLPIGEDETVYDITTSGNDITTLLSKDPSRFASLKSVTLELMKLREDQLANLFSACRSLKWLCLNHCDVAGIPSHHNLKFLDINNTLTYDPLKPDEVKIFCGPNLTSLCWKERIFQSMTIKLVNCDGRVFSSSSPSPLRHVRITEAISHHDNYAAFKYLQELSLTPEGLGDDDILNLLSHCSCLEGLSLSGGGSQLSHFKIPFPSHPLKYLELKDSMYLQFVELCSTNLATFELRTPVMVTLQVKQAPRLTRVTLELGNTSIQHEADLSLTRVTPNSDDQIIRTIKELSINIIQQLETLILFLGSSSSPLHEDKLKGVPKFKNLKRLVVCMTDERVSLHWVIPLIQIAPNLHLLEIHLGRRISEQIDIVVPSEIKHYHNHLKEVKISGFRGMKDDMEMAIYLLKYAAASLELMTVDTNLLIYEGNDTWKKRNGERLTWLPFVREWLMKHASSRTRLVIL